MDERAKTAEEVIAEVHGDTGAGAAGPLGAGVAVRIVSALKESGYVIGTHYVDVPPEHLEAPDKPKRAHR